ncbi:hypothetical protein BGX33_007128 [Mortierella sp. NVP41]|nr:hypothetical protein BGX33_007128 [Mortierella sp. NVP41]
MRIKVESELKGEETITPNKKKDKGKKRKVESKLEAEKAIPLYKDVEDELHMLLYQMPFGGIVIRENQTDGADPEEEIKRTPWFPINAPISRTAAVAAATTLLSSETTDVAFTAMP